MKTNIFFTLMIVGLITGISSHAFSKVDYEGVFKRFKIEENKNYSFIVETIKSGNKSYPPIKILFDIFDKAFINRPYKCVEEVLRLGDVVPVTHVYDDIERSISDVKRRLNKKLERDFIERFKDKRGRTGFLFTDLKSPNATSYRYRIISAKYEKKNEGYLITLRRDERDRTEEEFATQAAKGKSFSEIKIIEDFYEIKVLITEDNEIISYRDETGYGILDTRKWFFKEKLHPRVKTVCESF